MGSLFETLNPSTATTEQKLLCQFITQRGSPCMRAAVTGSSVCVLHGGSIPAAKEQIERALLALQESAIEALREVFATATDRVLADTAFKLLDRTGHGPQTTLKVQEDTDDLSSLSNEELLKKHQELGKFLEATRTNGTIVLGPNSGTTH